MFDPNMFGAMGDMMKNPEMVKQMEEMMKNPDIMDKAMNMMKDPNMANLFGGNMPNIDETDETPDCEDNDCCEKTISTFNEGDKVKLINLKSEIYNEQECVIKSFNTNSKRYNVLVKSLDKVISIKEDNIELNAEIVIEVN